VITFDVFSGTLNAVITDIEADLFTSSAGDYYVYRLNNGGSVRIVVIQDWLIFNPSVTFNFFDIR